MSDLLFNPREASQRELDLALADPRPTFGDQAAYAGRRVLEGIDAGWQRLNEGVIGPVMESSARDFLNGPEDSPLSGGPAAMLPRGERENSPYRRMTRENEDWTSFWQGVERRAQENMEDARARRRVLDTPDPVASTWASEMVYGLTQMLTLGGIGGTLGPVGSAAMLGPSYGAPAYEDFLDEGLDEETARGAALREGVSMAALGALPVAMPGRLFTRVASGAAINVPTGMAYRGSMESYLRERGYEEQASRYRLLDTQAIATDAILGAVFGGLFGARGAPHPPERLGGGGPAGPTPREPDFYLNEAGEMANHGDLAEAYANALIARELGHPEAQGLLNTIAEDGGQEVVADGSALASLIGVRDGLIEPTQEHIDAAMTLQSERHARVDTAPGIPLDIEAEARHAESLARAEQQFADGDDIDVADVWADQNGEGFAPHPRETLDADSARAEEAIRSVLDQEGFTDLAREIEEYRARVRQMGGDIGGDEAMFSMGRRQPMRGEGDFRGSEAFSDARLSPQQNKAVEMARNNYSNAEIADELDATTAQVSVLLAQAKARAPGLSVPPSRMGAPPARGGRGASIEEIVSLYNKLSRQGYRNGQGRPGPGRRTINTLIAERLGRGLTAGNVAKRLSIYRADLASGKIEGEPLYSMGRPAFESVVERVVANSKTARASGEQWWATISKAPGVKKEELQWIGLEDFLRAREGQITREEVLEFVRANGVRVEETVLGGEGADPALQARLLPLIEQRDRLERQIDPFVVRGRSLSPEERAQAEAIQQQIRATSAEINPLQQQIANQQRASSTKWSQYTLPGGENKKEFILRLPVRLGEGQSSPDYATRMAADASRNFRDTHYPEIPNPIGWVRTSERVDVNGVRTLMMEELQLSQLLKEYNSLRRLIAKGEANDAQRARFAEIEAMNWPLLNENTANLLLFKRMIRWASENGFDQIAWTRGDQQNARFSLEKQIDAIEYVVNRDGSTVTLNAIKNDSVAFVRTNMPVADLPGLVGKELADKIVGGAGETIRMGRNTGYRSLSGLDLAVGGEGMRAFYDRILVNIANDLGKKYGARVGETVVEIHVGPEGHSGFVAKETLGGGWDVYDMQKGEFVYGRKYTEAEARMLAAELHRGVKKGETVHSLPITPEMREASMEGMPLFSQGTREGFSSVESLIAEAEVELGADWGALSRAGNVEVVQASNDVPAGLLGLPRGVQAVYIPSERKTYFVANNIRPGDMRALILHEVGVHHGMEQMLGKRGFKEMLRQIDLMVDADHPLMVEARDLAERYAAHPDHIPEETLAYLVETHADLPLVASLLSKIRQWLIKTFGSTFGMRLTVDDLRALAVTSLRRVAEQARREAGEPVVLDGFPRFSNGPDAGHAGAGRLPPFEFDANEFSSRMAFPRDVPEGPASVHATSMAPTYMQPGNTRFGNSGTKFVTVNGEPVARAEITQAADGGPVTVQLIQTVDGAQRRGYARQLLDDLYAEFGPFHTTAQSQDGSALFANYVRQADGTYRPAPQSPDGGAGRAVSVSELRSRFDPFGQDNPWEVPQITEAEVRRAMAQGKTETRRFDDQGPDWTRQDHINRIATLAREGWDQPIDLTSRQGVADGVHRLAAAIIRGDETIATRAAADGAFGWGDVRGAHSGLRVQRDGARWQVVDADGAVVEQLPPGASFADAERARIARQSPNEGNAGDFPKFSQSRQNGPDLLGAGDARARRNPLQAPDYQARVGRVQEALGGNDAGREGGQARGQDNLAPIKDGDKPDKELSRQAREVLAVSGIKIARIENPMLGTLRIGIDSPVRMPARLKDALQEYPDARAYNTGIDFDVVEGGKNTADPSAPEGRRDGLYLRWTSVPDALQKSGVGSWLYRQVIDWAHRRGLTVYSDASITDKAWLMYTERLPEYGYEVEKIEATTRDPITKTHESVNDGPIWAIRQSYQEKPFDRAPIPREDYQIDGPPVHEENQQRLIEQIRRQEEYDNDTPVGQILRDKPEFKLSTGRRDKKSISAREAIEMSVEAQREAVAKKKAYEAAVRCAIRHGGSFITVAGRGAGQGALVAQMAGMEYGLMASLPVGWGVSHLAAQNADPQGYAEGRARASYESLRDAERRRGEEARLAGARAGLDAPSTYDDVEGEPLWDNVDTSRRTGAEFEEEMGGAPLQEGPRDLESRGLEEGPWDEPNTYSPKGGSTIPGGGRVPPAPPGVGQDDTYDVTRDLSRLLSPDVNAPDEEQ